MKETWRSRHCDSATFNWSCGAWKGIFERQSTVRISSASVTFGGSESRYAGKFLS